MTSTLRRAGAALVMVLGLLLTGCGMDAQTLKPYTPAEGVNVDAGPVKVRNLTVVADSSGKGVISASVVSATDNTLLSVSGTPHKADGTAGAPFTVAPAGLPLTMPANTLAVLTKEPVKLRVTSPDLKPGLLTDVVLTFGSGSVTLRAPVVDASLPHYAEIKLG